jgi:hypothetical protein
MDNQANNQPPKQILEKIKSGEVTMRSRSFFIWRNVLMLLALVLFALAGVFIVSFVIFALRTSGVSDLPQFGLHGVHEFLIYFPWLFLPAFLLFVWLIERFVRQYSFGYRIPLLYVSGAIVGIILVMSWVVLATPAHERLFESARANHLPLAGPFYLFFGNSHPDDFYMGQVISANPPKYVIQTRDGSRVSCETNKSTAFYDPTPIQVGDFIEMVGEEKGQVVTAYDIRKIPAPPLMMIHLGQ